MVHGPRLNLGYFINDVKIYRENLSSGDGKNPYWPNFCITYNEATSCVVKFGPEASSIGNQVDIQSEFSRLPAVFSKSD